MKVNYVAQEHKCGCTAAAVAMVVGKSYDEVQRCCYVDFNVDGRQIEDWYDYLFQNGFTFHRVYRVTQLQGPNLEREVWPPKPFAEVHLCSVVNTNGSHAVVMLADGTILDPAWPGTRTFADYISVSMVIGLFRRNAEKAGRA